MSRPHPALSVTLAAPGLPFVPDRRPLPATERVRLLFETERGTLPWRPKFGLDLSWLQGEALTRSALARVSEVVRETIHHNLPDVELEAVKVVARSDLTQRMPARERGVPIAEAALLPYGAGAHLEVHVTIRVGDHVEALTLPLGPTESEF